MYCPLWLVIITGCNMCYRGLEIWVFSCENLLLGQQRLPHFNLIFVSTPLCGAKITSICRKTYLWWQHHTHNNHFLLNANCNEAHYNNHGDSECKPALAWATLAWWRSTARTMKTLYYDCRCSQPHFQSEHPLIAQFYLSRLMAKRFSPLSTLVIWFCHDPFRPTGVRLRYYEKRAWASSTIPGNLAWTFLSPHFDTARSLMPSFSARSACAMCPSSFCRMLWIFQFRFDSYRTLPFHDSHKDKCTKGTGTGGWVVVILIIDKQFYVFV